MLKKIGLTIVGVTALGLTSLTSATTNQLQVGQTAVYVLAPNAPQEFVNPTLWQLKANCTITTEDDEDQLFVEGLAGKALLTIKIFQLINPPQSLCMLMIL